MIIKGVFRRYERWNPVHPTSGAFWGMGVGIGCGVGWGPGFGPEVIGYVGAGCGIGFSVGITFAGFGVGLPANILIEGPYKVLSATSSYTWDLVRSSSPLAVKSKFGDELSRNIPAVPSHLWSLQQKANEGFSHMKDLDLLRKGTEILDTRHLIFPQINSLSEKFRLITNRFSEPRKDDKE